MDTNNEFSRWMRHVTDQELLLELKEMNGEQKEDAFYRNLSFGTGGLRGVLGAGTNRMNIHVVAKASQGLSAYLFSLSEAPSVVIGYDSRINSKRFAETAAGVFAANGIRVYLWKDLLPVPTVSFAVRKLGASAGVMITASHNPSKYNGYKVYGPDGCQITTEAAKAIFARIDVLDIFHDVKTMPFSEAVESGRVSYIEDAVFTDYIEAVKNESVLYGDEVDRNVAIVYSPLNGTGLVPVTRVLQECGFTNITVVEEQRDPDGTFPTCPYPNPEVPEAMELGLAYCRTKGADLLIATDPDCDRVGIAVKGPDGNYELLNANETGILLMDYVLSQRSAHQKMPAHPICAKTIVTTDLAESIAAHYGAELINTLTGFKFIGEAIGRLKNEHDFVCGIEESYGYLTGTYVRDKDGVNAAHMICEMFAFCHTRGISLLDRLNELYDQYGYCLNLQHSYDFPGSAGMEKMKSIMEKFRSGLTMIGGQPIVKTEDYSLGLHGLPKSNVVKFCFEGEHAEGSLVVRPSGTEPKLKCYCSVTAQDKETAAVMEAKLKADIENLLNG